MVRPSWIGTYLALDSAAKFDVTVDFLVQHVTYLTEHHRSQMQAQMRKATAAVRSSAAPSPVPGSESAIAMGRTASGPGMPAHARAPSALSIRKDGPLTRNDGSLPNTPKAGPGTSFSTAAGSRPQVVPTSSSGNTPGPSRQRAGTIPPSLRTQSIRQPLSSLPIESPSTPMAGAHAPSPATDPPSPGPADSPSEVSSDASSSPAQSRIIRRPPRFQQQQHRDRDGTRSSFLDDMGEEEEEEAEPAFLPFRAKASGDMNQGGSDGSAQYTDPGATLRGDPRDFAANAARRLQNVTGGDSSQGKNKGKGKEKERVLHQSGTSESSASSAAFVSKRSLGDRRQPSIPLSPRRTVELKGKGYSREGSDGTPSMGSSFSDLDDASVTQSALEEALASKMQGGGTIGSTISNVFKSRVLPK